MGSKLYVVALLGIFYTCNLPAQNSVPEGGKVPIYQVTVIERTVYAVNYQYRSGPTKIDFRGTVLLPHAKGDATVESKAGRTQVEAGFEHLEAPTRFGREYLTYVLWAITPDGHAKNLGEVVANGSDHAHLTVTTDLQAFGLIVTAEPYSAVRQPSDVVVLENDVRPDTVGHIEPIQAKYELLPRGHYTYTVQEGERLAKETGPAVSFERYEQLVQLYEAQNAVQIARAAGADHYAADTFQRAQKQLDQAQQFERNHADRSTVVTAARQAAQTAEDARILALERKRAEELAQARESADREQQLRAQAEAAAQKAQAQASADRMQLDEERAARLRAEREATAAQAVPPAPPAQPVVTRPAVTAPASSNKAEVRARLFRELNGVLPVRDTARGLVITISDDAFRGQRLNAATASAIARIGSILAAHPGLAVRVEGYTDSSFGARAEQISYDRALVVRQTLGEGGIPASSITANGLGSSRPIASNASVSGRAQNRRVEITISGDPIGSVPYWDHTYSLLPR